MQTIKEIIQNKKHRNIVILCTLCVFVLGISMWFFIGKSDSDKVNLNEPQVPVDNVVKTTISAGDTIIINVLADKMDDVYGYQFSIHFDRDFIEYTKKRPSSDIDEILTIFAADKEWYLLVGATMIGDAQGYSGQKISVCRVEFVAVTDFELNSNFILDHIAISDVHVVTGDLQYLSNIEGWTASITVQ